MRTKYITLVLLCGIIIIILVLYTSRTKESNTLAPVSALDSTTPMLTLTSPAFMNNGIIPKDYTCDTQSARPPVLLVNGAPKGTKSFALIMEDPDLPEAIKQSRGIQSFIHWLLYNIPGNSTEIILGTTPSEWGITSANGVDYVPPCPPPELEPSEHRYIFTLYALDNQINAGSALSSERLRTLLAPHLLAETQLVGRYSRK